MIPFAIWTPSMGELTVILVLVVILFGLGKLPTAFTQMGKAVKNFRDAQKDEEPRDVTPRKLPEHDEVEEIEKEKLRS